MPHMHNKIRVEHRLLDINFAIYGMKYFFSYAKEPYIRFFSAGEATTAFDLMIEIYKEAKKIAGKNLKVELQTNGFFSEKVADWIEKHIDILWISFDGPPEIQDLQRPTLNGSPSSQIVLKNIYRFTKSKSIQFGIRSTFLKENFRYQKDIIEYFHSIGIKYVCGAPAYSSNVNQEVDVPCLVDFAKAFVPAFYAAQKMKMFYLTHLIVNFDEKVDCYCRSCTIPPAPHLTTDGYISCCDWASFGPDYFPGILQECIYGKWDYSKQMIKFFDRQKQKIENRNIKKLAKVQCSGCNLLCHCAGGCIGKVIVRSGSLLRIDRNWCQAVKYLAQYLPLNQGLYPILHS